MTSEYTELLTELLQQEEEIQFSGFNNDMAFAVGTALLDAARSKGKAVARLLFQVCHKKRIMSWW